MSSRAALRSRPVGPLDPPGRPPSPRPVGPPPVRERRPGPVGTWLLVIRASALPLTLGAGLVGVLLALRAGGSWRLGLLALLGVVLAHACHHLLQRLSDRGVDGDDRAAAHPIGAGLVRRRQVGLAVVGALVAASGVLAALVVSRGWPALAFAAAGAVLSTGYATRPLRLKARGLGELAVLVACGPLVVAGAFLAAAGDLPWQVWAASLPYGLLCASVVTGKHLDDLPYDLRAGTRTLAVRLGESGARVLTLLLVVGSYATTGLAVAVGALPWPALLVALGLPLLRSVAATLRRPLPQPPPGGPARLSRYGSVLLGHLVCAGGLLVLGLALATVLDLGVSFG